jgi:hypothetical protein
MRPSLPSHKGAMLYSRKYLSSQWRVKYQKISLCATRFLLRVDATTQLEIGMCQPVRISQNSFFDTRLSFCVLKQNKLLSRKSALPILGASILQFALHFHWEWGIWYVKLQYYIKIECKRIDKRETIPIPYPIVFHIIFKRTFLKTLP